jgi:transcriptional regulator with XRE-family HTH domain
MAEQKIYNRVKAVLAEKGKTSKELAELLNISSQTVSRWCTNSRQPSVEALYDIARVLKVDARDLLVASS